MDVSGTGVAIASASFFRSARDASGDTMTSFFVISPATGSDIAADSATGVLSSMAGESAAGSTISSTAPSCSFAISVEEKVIVVFLLDSRGNVSQAVFVTFLRTTS